MSSNPYKEIAAYDTLFSYGHLRKNYLNSDMSSGRLLIKNFLRQNHIEEVKKITIEVGEKNYLSPIYRQILWELHSGIMIRAIENITGALNLLPDTNSRSSGLLLEKTTALSNCTIYDEKTKLNARLILIISLVSGDAMVFSDFTLLKNLSIDEESILATYWENTINAG